MADKRTDKFMKFGPEWLHNLSQDNNTPAASTSTPPTPTTSSTTASASYNNNNNNNTRARGQNRCRLADHRYGREEMLALFDGNVSPPTDLTNHEELYVNRAQLPLALQAESAEDESTRRNWPSRNAPPKVGTGPLNAGIRPLMGKAGPQEFPPQRGRPKPNYYYQPDYISGGRGRGTMNRNDMSEGRIGMEPPEWDNSNTFYNNRKEYNGNYGGRSRLIYSRKAVESNLARGISDPIGEGEIPPPYHVNRKEYTGGYHRGHDANWRRSYGRGTEEEDAWRASGDGPGPRPRQPNFGKKLSWRDEDAEREAHKEKGYPMDKEWSERGGDRRERPPWANNRKTWAGESHSPDDLLPEWANPDNSAIPSGSFDSSGAFHEDEKEAAEVSRSPIQHSQSATMVFDKKVPLTRGYSQGNMKAKSTSSGPFMRAIVKASIENPNASNAKVFNATDIGFLNKKVVKTEEKADSKIDVSVSDTTESISTSQDVPVPEVKVDKGSVTKPVEKHVTSDSSKIAKPVEIASVGLIPEKQSQPVASEEPKFPTQIVQKESHPVQNDTTDATVIDPYPNTQNKSVEDMMHDIVKMLVLEDEDTVVKNGKDNSTNELLGQQQHSNASAVPNPMVPPGLDPMAQKHPHNYNTEQNKPASYPDEGENWFYRDPQGDVQGPFSSAEMADWFDSGYFSSTLFIRRGCDYQFVMLGQLIALCGGYIPFLLPNHILSKVYENSIPVDPIDNTMDRRFMPSNPPNYQMRGMPGGAQVPPPMAQYPQHNTPVATDMIQQPPIHFMADWGAAPHNASGVYWQPGHPPPNYPHPGMMVPPPRPEFMHQTHQPIRQHDPIPVQSVWDSQDQKKPIVLEQLYSSINQQHPSTLNQPQQEAVFMDVYQKPKPNYMNLYDVEKQQVEALNHAHNIPAVNQIPPTQVVPQFHPNMSSEMPVNVVYSNYPDTVEQSMRYHIPPPIQPQVPQESFFCEADRQESAYVVNPATLEPLSSFRPEPMQQIPPPAPAQNVDLREVSQEKTKTSANFPKGQHTQAVEPQESKRKQDTNKGHEKKKPEETKKKAEVEKKKKKEESENIKVDTKIESVKKKPKQVTSGVKEVTQEKPVEKDQPMKKPPATKPAPWCAVRDPSPDQSNNLSLAEIQRLEREQKNQQLKDLQQLIAEQEQAEAEQREMQMRVMKLRWVDHKLPSPKKVLSLAEIQAEEQLQMVKAAAAAKLVPEKELPLMNILAPSSGGIWGPPTAAASSSACWWQSPNGGSNWECIPDPLNSVPGVVENQSAPKSPKHGSTSIKNCDSAKPTTVKRTVVKKEVLETSKPSISHAKSLDEGEEFKAWSSSALSTWSGKIEVPAFLSFLQSLEAPYEVKEYAKYYLGDTKESSDFARQYIEKRSKLRRHTNVIPSDDLCAPAAAVNPGMGADFQDCKGKGRRNKKNKMLKIDSRILGFNVTAAADRFNVGDIDTV